MLEGYPRWIIKSILALQLFPNPTNSKQSSCQAIQLNVWSIGFWNRVFERTCFTDILIMHHVDIKFESTSRYLYLCMMIIRIQSYNAVGNSHIVMQLVKYPRRVIRCWFLLQNLFIFSSPWWVVAVWSAQCPSVLGLNILSHNVEFISSNLMSIYSQYITNDIHYSDVTTGAMASRITSFTIVYKTDYSSADQIKHQSSASLAFVRGIHRWPVYSPHQWPVTQKMFSFGDIIMSIACRHAKDIKLGLIVNYTK